MFAGLLRCISVLLFCSFAIVACVDNCPNGCVNGDCIEDGCLCDPGFEGSKCDVVAQDFSGFYYGESLTYTECNNPVFNETTFADNQLRFCESRGEETYCREMYLEILQDNSYKLIISDIFKSPGTEELRIPDVTDGFYTTEGDKMILCSTNNNVCETMIRADNGQELIWKREGATCTATYRFFRL